MNRRQIALKLAVGGLGLPFQVDRFEDRLILQKALYLAQAAGVHLGYHYQWYLYGPYSPSLTRDEYVVAEEPSQAPDESEGWTLDKESNKRLERLRGLIGRKQQAELARELELLASVHFLITRKQVTRDNDDEEIVGALRRFGKDFAEEDVERARGELNEHGLL